MSKYYKSFHKNTWDVMSEEEKTETLQEVENHYSSKQKRATRPIVIANVYGCGFYNSKDDKITINRDILTNAGSAFYSTVHEGFHPYQCDVFNNKIKDQGNNAAIWKKNFNGYLDPRKPEVKSYDYFFQPLEKDANEYTMQEYSRFTKKCKDPDVIKDYNKWKAMFEYQRKLAIIEYGHNNIENGIQKKIDAEFIAKQNTYFTVNATLSKTGLKTSDVFSNSIMPSCVNDNNQLNQQQRDIAAKYGFSERAAESAARIMEEKKKFATKPKKSTNSKSSVTSVKVTVKSEKQKSK